MPRIETGSYPLCEVNYIGYPDAEHPRYEAYCDSDCAEQVDFVPYDPETEVDGDVVVWFADRFIEKLNIEDERIDYMQPGYVYNGVEVYDYIDFINEADSVGRAANYLFIQPYRNIPVDIVWRERVTDVS